MIHFPRAWHHNWQHFVKHGCILPGGWEEIIKEKPKLKDKKDSTGKDETAKPDYKINAEVFAKEFIIRATLERPPCYSLSPLHSSLSTTSKSAPACFISPMYEAGGGGF